MPKKYGPATRPCRKCGRTGAVTRKYGLMLCRQCLREEARKIGFKKYS